MDLFGKGKKSDIRNEKKNTKLLVSRETSN